MYPSHNQYFASHSSGCLVLTNRTARAELPTRPRPEETPWPPAPSTGVLSAERQTLSSSTEGQSHLRTYPV